LHSHTTDFFVIAAKKLNAQDARGAAFEGSRQILNRGKRFFFRAKQNIARHERRRIRRAARLNLKNHEAEYFLRAGSAWNESRMKRYSEPRIRRSARKKIAHRVAWNREREASRDVASAPTNPMGLPIAIASSPGLNSEESPAEADGKFFASMRSSARSRRGSRERTVASNSRPSHS
jgi:hypothetical protein